MSRLAEDGRADAPDARNDSARAANRDALGALYDSHAPSLRGRCLRLTGDADAADDLMQEAFARFIARFPEPPSDMNVDAYLHATARNVFLKQIRDRRETPAGDIETVLGADDDLERDPERATLLVEQQTLVRRCAAMLTRRQRNALRMCEVEGNSYAEIGSELGIGVDAVGQVVSRARTRLRGALRRAQIDLDHLSPECRALLGPLSDYVDGRARTTSSEIESHLAECSACRATLASYQEAGSRLRGIAPLAPIAALCSRIGAFTRIGADGPIGLGAAASLATAAAITVGCGGFLAANQLSSSGGSQAATTTLQAQDDSARARAVSLSSAPAEGEGAGGTATAPPGTQVRATTTTQGPQRRRDAPTAKRDTPARATPTSPAQTAAGADAPLGTGSATATEPGGAAGAADATPSPGVKAPKVRVPGVTTPKVTVPAVTVPAVTTPAATVPAIEVPPVTTPAVTTPVGTVPAVTTPTVSTPTVTVPQVTVPPITLPAPPPPPVTPPTLP